MADDKNKENQQENDTASSHLNQLSRQDPVEDALAAHVSLWQEAQYQKNQNSEFGAPSPSTTPTQSGDEDSPKSKK